MAYLVAVGTFYKAEADNDNFRLIQSRIPIEFEFAGCILCVLSMIC